MTWQTKSQKSEARKYLRWHSVRRAIPVQMNGDRPKPRDLRDRTREFALRIIKLYCALPKRVESQVIGKQILRSGTAVGANYREGVRARSKSEYAAKLNIGLMEIEETLYWLELLEGSGIVSASRLSAMKSEISELTAIFVTLIKRAKLQPGSQESSGAAAVP